MTAELATPVAHRVNIIRAGNVSMSAESTLLRGVDGTPLAELDMAPPMAATLTIKELRRRPPVGPAPDAETLRLVGELFGTATLGGMTPGQYCDLQARSAGVPIRV